MLGKLTLVKRGIVRKIKHNIIFSFNIQSNIPQNVFKYSMNK